MTIDVAPLGGREIGPAGDAVASTARDRMGAILGCMRPLPPTPTDVWIVGRVGVDGRLAGLKTAADVPTAVGECAIEALAGIRVPSGDPFALSIVLRGEPAPADCQGVDCVRLPVRSGLVAKDGPAGAWSGAPINMIGAAGSDPIGGVGVLAPIGPGGDGIGLGSIGALGRGVGVGTGRRSGKNRSALTIRIGAASVSGHLPPEVIQRIVRQNVGRFRLCYEQGLKTNATLGGSVTLVFTIANDGSISEHSASTSSLPDPKVVSCVENALSTLTFPAPEGGVVKVTNPIFFAPPVEPEVLHVGGLGFRALDAAKVAAHLGAKGWRVMSVPGDSDTEPFAVFAVEADASTNPLERPQGFVTSVRREPAEGSTPGDSRESEGLRFVASGDDPAALLDDLVDKAEP